MIVENNMRSKHMNIIFFFPTFYIALAKKMKLIDGNNKKKRNVVKFCEEKICY